MCLLVFCLPVCMLMNPVGHTFAYVHTRARMALSARSGFNWMMDTLLTLTVSVIQTLNRSHRLQQASPLSIKANPLSPATRRWSNDKVPTDNLKQVIPGHYDRKAHLQL